MKPHAIRPYYVGLGIIGLFAVVLILTVFVLGLRGRQDTLTYKKSVEIASKMQVYLNDSAKPPKDLRTIGVKDVPKSINYTRASDTTYKFCANYQAKSKGFNRAATVFNTFTDDSNPTSGSWPYSRGQIELNNGVHDKGNNCQTIDVSGSFDSGTNPVNDTCPYPGIDSSDKAYQEYVDCLDANDPTQATPTTPGTTI